MFIAGAGTLRYGDIVQVIDAAKGAGVEKVGIVTERMRAGGGTPPPRATNRTRRAAAPAAEAGSPRTRKGRGHSDPALLSAGPGGSLEP